MISYFRIVLSAFFIISLPVASVLMTSFACAQESRDSDTEEHDEREGEEAAAD